MITVELVNAEATLRKSADAVAADLLAIKQNISNDLPEWFAYGRSQNPTFPQNSDAYSLIVKSGRTPPRRLKPDAKVFPDRMSFPFNATWVSGGSMTSVIEAAIAARNLILRRVNWQSGEYARKTNILIANRIMSATAAKALAPSLETTTIVGVTTETAYANTIEAGYYKGRYGLRGGIYFYTAKRIREEYEVSCEFGYRAGQSGGSFPVIYIGLPGLYRGRDAIPGRSKRRKRR